MENEEIVRELCEVINKAQVPQEKVIDIIAGFLYSVGQSLEEEEMNTSEKVLMKYAEKPTLGVAMMAQALWIKENWKPKMERKEKTNE